MRITTRARDPYLPKPRILHTCTRFSSTLRRILYETLARSRCTSAVYVLSLSTKHKGDFVCESELGRASILLCAIRARALYIHMYKWACVYISYIQRWFLWLSVSILIPAVLCVCVILSANHENSISLSKSMQPRDHLYNNALLSTRFMTFVRAFAGYIGQKHTHHHSRTHFAYIRTHSDIINQLTRFCVKSMMRFIYAMGLAITVVRCVWVLRLKEDPLMHQRYSSWCCCCFSRFFFCYQTKIHFCYARGSSCF